MGKNNINRHKSKENKELIKPNLIDKYINPDKFNNKESIKRKEIRKKKHIWLWIILLPPIGIYKSIKYKAFPKAGNYFISIFFLVALILSIDAILYPNRVLDMNIMKNIKSNDEIGHFRQGEITDTFDNKYLVYNVVTTNGIYDIYLSNNGKVVNAIIQNSPERELIYEEDIDIKESEIYSEILLFLDKEENKEKFGEIEDVLDSNLNYQKVKTTNGTYNFFTKYNFVTVIEKIEEDGSKQDVYNEEPVLSLPKKISKILDKRKDKLGELEEVLSYSINEDVIEYIVKMNNEKYYKLSIDNENTVTIYNGDTN